MIKFENAGLRAPRKRSLGSGLHSQKRIRAPVSIMIGLRAPQQKFQGSRDPPFAFLRFLSLFLSTQKSTTMIKKLSRLFLEFGFVLATQSNSKSGEAVSQVIQPEWFVEKSAVKTDIYLEKEHRLVCVRKYPICIKCPPFLTFVLYPTKQVNYKVSSTAKNYTLLLSPNNPTEAGKFLLQWQDKLHKKTLTKTTAARSSQEAVMTSHCS